MNTQISTQVSRVLRTDSPEDVADFQAGFRDGQLRRYRTDARTPAYRAGLRQAERVRKVQVSK